MTYVLFAQVLSFKATPQINSDINENENQSIFQKSCPSQWKFLVEARDKLNEDFKTRADVEYQESMILRRR